MAHYLHRKLLRDFSLWNITISHHIQSWTLQCCIPLQFEIDGSDHNPTSSTKLSQSGKQCWIGNTLKTPDRPTIASITRELEDWEGWVPRWVVNYPLGSVRDLLDKEENLKHGPMGWCPRHAVGLGSNRRKRFKQMQRQGKIKIFKYT